MLNVVNGFNNGLNREWPMADASLSAEKIDAENYKWIIRDTYSWDWAKWLSNTAGYDEARKEGNRYFGLTGIVLMNLQGGGGEFYGKRFPQVTVNGFKGGVGNVWTTISLETIATVENPILNNVTTNINDFAAGSTTK